MAEKKTRKTEPNVQESALRYEELPSAVSDLSFQEAASCFEVRNRSLDPETMNALHLTDPKGRFTNLGLLLSDQCLHIRLFHRE